MKKLPFSNTIIEIREMTPEEIRSEGWEHEDPPMVIVLDDGTKIYPSQDPEGNGPGIFFGVDSKGKQFLL